MARIEIEENVRMSSSEDKEFWWVPFHMPRCSGCGATFEPRTVPMLHVRSMTPFDKEHRSHGLSATLIAEFAEAHKKCPEPIREVVNGISIVDKRKR